MKFVLKPLFAALVLLSVISCQKKDNDDVTLNQTVNGTINQGETFRYNLPQPKSGSFAVESAGATNSSSSVESNATSRTFIYNPSANYTGNDVVVVSNQATQQNTGNSGCSNEHHNCGHRGHHHCSNNGGCHKGDGGLYRITFNITVLKSGPTK